MHLSSTVSEDAEAEVIFDQAVEAYQQVLRHHPDDEDARTIVEMAEGQGNDYGNDDANDEEDDALSCSSE